LPPVATSARTARQFVRSTLRAWGCPALVDVAELVVCELVTNAVLHARTDTVVRLRCHDGGVRVEVIDASPTMPAVSSGYADDASTGRGLALVEALASMWGVEPHVNGVTGKLVWCEVAA
jgi:anti-sigma regulatory factor (Ser/Thr protein kinase)